MEEAMSAIRRTGAEMGLPYLMGLYAEALGETGDLGDARKSIEAALELGRYNGTYFQLAELLRIEACIRDKDGGDGNEIEAMLSNAANVATLQGSAIGRLRVAVERARRHRKRGDPDKARRLVAPFGDLLGKLQDTADGRAAAAELL
jgi:hypothetical protein